jgi:uncharacterized membrane protein YbhN (UPF0104 family)
VIDSYTKKIQGRIFSALSLLLSLAAIAFVIEKIWRVRFQIFEKIDIRQIGSMILVGSVIYALDNFLIIFAWRHLVDWLGRTKTTWQTALKIYGRTQITKYIPGNVLQFPSRHILGIQFGLDHKPLLGAGIFEIVGLLVAASTISLLGIFAAKNQIEALSLRWLALIFLIGVFSPLLLHIAFSSIPFLQKINLLPKTIGETYKGLLPTWFAYLFFFLFAGGILYGLAYGISQLWISALFPVALSAYAVSWLAGTITPGSPGGMGVREAILILFLSAYFGEPTSVLIALTSRLVTVFGDFYIYIFAQLSQ